MKLTKKFTAVLTALTLTMAMTAFAADQTINIPGDEKMPEGSSLAADFTGVTDTQPARADWGGGTEEDIFDSLSVNMQTGGSITIPDDANLHMFISPYELKPLSGEKLAIERLTFEEYPFGDYPAWYGKDGRAELDGMPCSIGLGGPIPTKKGQTLRFLSEGQFSLSLTVENGDNAGSYACFLTVTGAAAPSATPTAAASTAKLMVDGKPVACEAYTIANNNYFKLRDVAAALSGTEKQFSVSYDEATAVIRLTAGEAYTPVGGELQAGSGVSQSTKPGTAKVLVITGESKQTLDGSVFEIKGNNYFKLRDLGEKLDFSIGWDEATQTITIDTAKPYTAA